MLGLKRYRSVGKRSKSTISFRSSVQLMQGRILEKLSYRTLFLQCQPVALFGSHPHRHRAGLGYPRHGSGMFATIQKSCKVIKQASKFLLSDDFRGWMTTIVQDLSDDELRQRALVALVLRTTVDSQMLLLRRRGSGNTSPLANLLSNMASGASPSPVVMSPMGAVVAAAKRGYGAYKES